MATVIPNGQSRIIGWLGEDLILASSVFNANRHLFFALSSTNGASQSWQAGRALNSLPNGTLYKLGVYRVVASGASLTLPDHVAGAGGAVDLQYVLGGNSPTTNQYLTTNGDTYLTSDGQTYAYIS